MRLPSAMWVPSTRSQRVYRGSPEEMVRDMARAASNAPEPPTEEAVRRLQDALRSARGIAVVLPEGLSDEEQAEAFLHALLDLGIGEAVPQL